MFGYTAQEMLGSPMTRLIPHDLSDEEPQLLERLGRGERIDHFETRRQRKNGQVFPVSVSISPIKDRSGAIVGASTIVRDISSLKEVERLKTEFVSTVSHELRTPLTSIRGALGLVIGRFADSLPEVVRELLETANRNGERLTLLIDDILDLEKLKAGQLDFDFKQVDLADLARKAVAADEAYGQKHGVGLRLLEVPDVAIVWADPHRLLQVLANLLSNAVKYSPGGGVVEVGVRRLDGRFRVTVRDYGRGIPQAFRSRIFQRFSQADSSDTREKGGTGLGLAITMAIIHEHGGSIDFSSEEGAGTEFFFELPEWSEAGQDGRSPPPAGASASTR